jgi:hypothetical protein
VAAQAGHAGLVLAQAHVKVADQAVTATCGEGRGGAAAEAAAARSNRAAALDNIKALQ